jgi:hypothetical protein
MAGETALARMDLGASRADDIFALSAFIGGPQEGFPHFPNEVLQRIGKEGWLTIFSCRYQATIATTATIATDIKKLEEASPYLWRHWEYQHRASKWGIQP